MQTDSNSMMQMQGNEIVLYQSNDAIHLEVRLAEESVWLTQQQIATLFGVQQPAISKHLNNIFKSGELDEDSVYSIKKYFDHSPEAIEVLIFNTGKGFSRYTAIGINRSKQQGAALYGNRL